MTTWPLPATATLRYRLPALPRPRAAAARCSSRRVRSSSLRNSCSEREPPHTLHSSSPDPGEGGAAVPWQPGRGHMYLSKNRCR